MFQKNQNSEAFMYLSQILFPSETVSHGFSDILFEKPCAYTGEVSKGDVFFSENGASYIKEAIEKGACAIVLDAKTALSPLEIPVFRVENVRKQYALAWARYTGHPEKSLRLIAVTGTNGKTSVSYFLSKLLQKAGYPTGLVGTVEYTDGKNRYPSDYTTPPPERLYPLLQKMKENGVTFAVMEASSHAIAQERLYGLTFELAIFTNLTRDHIDYHKTWDTYKATKSSLFRNAEHSLLNLDDPSAKDMAWQARGDVYYYGQNPSAELVIEHPLCTKYDIRYSLRIGNELLPLQIPLVGGFHIENTAAAISAAYLMGIPKETLQSSAALLQTPTGRLERLDTDTEYDIYIDYAHTPDALKKALTALRPHTERLTVLFGAGGDRDRGKRPEMGKVADALSDRIILTSDNPRSESPRDIIADMMRGIQGAKTLCIPDRKEAIEYALATATAGEILLLAGKGHETYLIDKNGKHDFSERDIVSYYLQRKGKENVSQHE
jgi:UDP-N-acetylmuramoyl-L-alanyl-D-glutamate--2,6-diaminopimelate ligase